MNQVVRLWRSFFAGAPKAGESGRLPPVPLGWRGGRGPGIYMPEHASPPEPPQVTVRPVTITPTPGAVASASPVPFARPAAPAPSAQSISRATAPSRATEHDLSAMRRAIELARQALAVGEVPVGAVVYDTATGKIIGEGSNRREIDKDPTAHAELIAIREAAHTIGDWRLNRCTLVITLEPCAMCAGLIVNARVGRLVYGARDPKAGAAESLYHLTSDPRLNHRVEPISEVMQGECAKLLSDFFQMLRKKGKAE